jgi:hypothetical protein
MSRKRSVSSDISTDPKIEQLSEHGTLPLLLYTWGISHADDWGRITGDPRQFRLTVCPSLAITAVEVELALDRIAAVGLWSRYVADGKPWIAFDPTDWKQMQSQLVAKARRKPFEVRGKRREQVFARDKYVCRHCGCSNDLTIDHILPISRGGTADPENLQTLCRPCNRAKGVR